MHSTLRSLAFALVAVVAGAHLASAQQVTGTCRPDDDTSAQLLTFFQNLVQSTTPADVTLRQQLGVDGVASSDVTVAREPNICTHAARAMRKLDQSPQSSYAIYVVHVGRSFAVVEPSWHAGEWVQTVVFDHNWKMRKTVLAF